MKIIRTAVTVLVVAVNFIVLTPWMLWCRGQHRKNTPEGREKCARLAPKLISYMTGCVMKLSGATFDIIGEENIPDRPCVLVGNHQSFFEVIGLLAYSDRMGSYLSKTGIKKIPFLGPWMETIDCVFIDRGNAREGMKAIKEATEKVRLGCTMHIFPEGTRSRDGQIGEFNAGAFMIATRTKAPIVPFLVEGTRSIFEDNGNLLAPGKASVTFFPPVETEGLTREEINSLNTRIRDFLVEEQKKVREAE